ncbi:MAG: AraC family transcriptional regulator ligand-binding domain-containing protein [Deltaproteobacteria bacterium]|nr:AraC family transcriptional regulator ligand-binding domain-containing protein [Deltaproteobacteria bacterium]
MNGISVALLRPLVELMGRLQIDPVEVLASLGIDEATTPETYVAGDVVDQCLEDLAVRRADPAFALTLARASTERPVGMFGHMVWLSGTLRDALTRASKFWAMVSRRSTLSFDEGPGGIATIRQRPISGIPHGRILTEYAFASLALRARAATNGAFTLRAVRFVHAGELVPAYREVFGAPVSFGARVDELELDSAQLELRLAGADPITSAALEIKVAELAAATPSRSPFLDRVRRAAVANLEQATSLTAVARSLGISSRTLRRHLEQEATTLRALVDDVRRERADELLAAGTSIKEIAFALGFSEPSAFSRAYKRWTGRAPNTTAAR